MKKFFYLFFIISATNTFASSYNDQLNQIEEITATEEQEIICYNEGNSFPNGDSCKCDLPLFWCEVDDEIHVFRANIHIKNSLFESYNYLALNCKRVITFKKAAVKEAVTRMGKGKAVKYNIK